MVVKKIEINLFVCNKCGHEWITKLIYININNIPKSCPRCNTKLWNSKKTSYIGSKFRKLFLSKQEIEKIKKENKRVNK